jgi:hypothetical protein
MNPVLKRITNQFPGIHNGRFGGLAGSPVFGPGGIGPFNNPISREERIDLIADFNRNIAGQRPLNG